MNFHFKQTMADATRMVRAGDLRGATAMIQAALSRKGPAAATDVHPATREAGFADVIEAAPAQAEVIDVPARFVPDADAHEAAQSTPEPVQEMPEPVIEPQGEGDFIAGSFSNGHDQRDYKLFVPPGAGARALPLVVMLHGCTQNPDDFAAGTAMNDAALAQGFYVLYPAQSRRANPQGCWNWYKHTHQQRDRGEPALLAGMTREIMADHRIDPKRVYVAGLSAGGAMAAILGDTYPDLYAAVGVHSGLATGTATDLPSAMMAMGGAGKPPGRAASGVPTIAFHGDADSTVHASNADHVLGACVGDTCSVDALRVKADGVRDATRSVYRSADGRVVAELWKVHGAPHAWSGGSAKGSFTDGRGPDASAEMLRFFFEHPRPRAM